MLTWLLTKMSTIKGYLIAFALFIVGLLAAGIAGRQKQKSADLAQAGKVATETLNKISNTAQAQKDDVNKLPPAGPDSAAQQLHDDWSDGN